MSDEEPKALQKRSSVLEVRQAREQAIAILTEHLVEDTIDLEEFEARLTRAHSAETPDAIAAVHADLPALASAPRMSVAVARASDVRPEASLYAVLGGITRSGAWAVPKHVSIDTVLGGAQLDLREAQFGPGVTEIKVRALLGGVQIIVPPGLAVQTEGSSILGGFDHVGRSPAHPDPDAPLLRIEGVAILGGVAVETRLPGEGEKEAHQRRKKERRSARRALPAKGT
jgi:hypothetical protein